MPSTVRMIERTARDRKYSVSSVPMSSGLNDGVAVICSKYDRMSSCRLFGISSNTGRKSSIEMPSRATSALTNIRSGSRENSRKYDKAAAACGMPSEKKRSTMRRTR